MFKYLILNNIEKLLELGYVKILYTNVKNASFCHSPSVLFQPLQMTKYKFSVLVAQVHAVSMAISEIFTLSAFSCLHP